MCYAMSNSILILAVGGEVTGVLYTRSGVLALVHQTNGMCTLINTKSIRLGYHYLCSVTGIKLVHAAGGWVPLNLNLDPFFDSMYAVHIPFGHTEQCTLYMDSPMGNKTAYCLPRLGLCHIGCLQRFARRVIQRRRDRLVAVMMGFHLRLGVDSVMGKMLDVDLATAFVNR